MPKELRSIDDLVPDAKNANQGTERGRYLLEQSFRELGAGRSVVTDAEGRMIGGNKALEIAEELGLPIEVIRSQGDKLVVVQRTDLDLSNDHGKARQLAYFDNRTAEIGLSWSVEQIVADLDTGVDLEGMFRESDLRELLENMPFGDTSTDREGQGVASPWYKYKTDPDRQYITVGEMEIPVDGEVLERLRQALEARFLDGVAYKQTLEAIIGAGLDASENSAD